MTKYLHNLVLPPIHKKYILVVLFFFYVLRTLANKYTHVNDVSEYRSKESPISLRTLVNLTLAPLLSLLVLQIGAHTRMLIFSGDIYSPFSVYSTVGTRSNWKSREGKTTTTTQNIPNHRMKRTEDARKKPSYPSLILAKASVYFVAPRNSVVL